MNNRPKKSKSLTKNMIFYMRLITVGIVFLFAVVTVRMYYLQIYKHEEYKSKATDIQMRDTIISSKRGTIFDTNMNVLAQSATVWTVVVSPNDSKEDQHVEMAEELGAILSVDAQTILDKIKKDNSYYEVIKYKVEKPVADAVRQLCIDREFKGVSLIEDYKRYYPYEQLAATLIGFCGSDNQGLLGLEAYYDDELSGTTGKIISAKNGWGLDMGLEYEVITEAQNGLNLVTTIDETIQHYLERHLSLGVDVHNVAEGGVGIVMNVKTGEILAMSNKPDFDPNAPFEIQDENLLAQINAITDETEKKEAVVAAQNKQWRNKAVGDLYEPGSVFKIVTASAALDSGKFSLNSNFYCTGGVQVGVHLMKCSHTSGHGAETFAQALINSCNPAFIEMGQGMGVETFYDYFCSFGLSEKTGIDIIGEADSLHHDEDMSIVNLSSSSFGQTNKITPIQMITAVAAATNGGDLVTPHLGKQLVDDKGNIVEDLTPEVKRQVISEDTSKKINQILQDNVSSFNGKDAYVSGFRVGGKSGTSQKLDTPQDDDYIASFVGIAPMDDPEIAILIFFDDPNSYSYYGGYLAAPVVGTLMGDILPYLGIEPVYTEQESETKNSVVPNITGETITEASSISQRAGFYCKIIGEGDIAQSQFPVAGTIVPKNSTIIVYTQASETLMVKVPNLIGLNVKDAVSALEKIGLNVKEEGASSANGDVTVKAQSINGKDEVPIGTTITITLTGSNYIE